MSEQDKPIIRYVVQILLLCGLYDDVPNSDRETREEAETLMAELRRDQPGTYRVREYEV